MSPDEFIEAVRKNNPKIPGMSALLTTTPKGIPETITALEDAGLRESVRS